ncbi:hypothetical protein PF010_g30950 [Phytophthora fragariae]|uniref:Uncharacterized protein n=1 Tax=Phytophthora fragariae TaxID=53985 RepID=A0A6A3GL84_9STRA|nr:hypothetical protein PF011_g30506 [Phytophthora fragariae]KAE9058568.1 hypothetical protein PF010_g30950 [Phytophthora fragariae]KAE9160902.1 hypothetical protein PF004_g31011 [Phytophthora fragariae]
MSGLLFSLTRAILVRKGSVITTQCSNKLFGTHVFHWSCAMRRQLNAYS